MPATSDASFEMPLTVLPVSQEETLGALLVGTFCALMCVPFFVPVSAVPTSAQVVWDFPQSTLSVSSPVSL